MFSTHNASILVHISTVKEGTPGLFTFTQLNSHRLITSHYSVRIFRRCSLCTFFSSAKKQNQLFSLSSSVDVRRVVMLHFCVTVNFTLSID